MFVQYTRKDVAINSNEQAAYIRQQELHALPQRSSHLLTLKYTGENYTNRTNKILALTIVHGRIYSYVLPQS